MQIIHKKIKHIIPSASNGMHPEVLTKKQIELLPLIKLFSSNFGLVGGTAIALQIGHRGSLDFDLFTNKRFDNLSIREKILKYGKIEKVLVDHKDEYTVLIKGTKITFLYYPFQLAFSKNFNNIIKMADLLTIAAMKAYALGRRAKWKDYVDLYFILSIYSMDKIIQKADKIFGSEFDQKLFKVQLSYFKDIDYSEKIIYRDKFQTSDNTIKKGLLDFIFK